MAGSSRARRVRVRMSSTERREQLVTVARGLFASRGLDATSVEEIAAAAGVSKPIVYEHFGGKEGLYAVVVDRELRALSDAIRGALTSSQPTNRDTFEAAVLAWLDYIEANPDGFSVLARGTSVGPSDGTFASLVSDVAARVEDLLADSFGERGIDRRHAPLYARALVGMVTFTGQWWLEAKTPAKEVVAQHLLRLAWDGLANFDKPR